MNFNQEPHPVIEEHYHIQDLIKGQQKRSMDRSRHQSIEKARNAFIETIRGFKDREILDFWCDKCQTDFVARSQKQVDAWADIAYYKIKHTCETWCIRHITDRHLDSYFFKSKKVAMDRRDNFTNLLQPFETGFTMLYGKK